jgi:hypothetical protein
MYFLLVFVFTLCDGSHGEKGPIEARTQAELEKNRWLDLAIKTNHRDEYMVELSIREVTLRDHLINRTKKYRIMTSCLVFFWRIHPQKCINHKEKEAGGR